jgi:dephospho-CoA kinase
MVKEYMIEKQVIIGLVGESGAGKDTVADYLKHRYDATLLRFSDPLKKTLSMLVERPSREDQAWLAMALKNRFGKDVLFRMLTKQMVDSSLISLNGLRYKEDEDFLRSFPNNVLIYVTSDPKLRWERSTKRGEKSDDNISFEEFMKLETTLETERAIVSLGKEAEYTVYNDSTLEDLFVKVDDIMREVLEKFEHKKI